MSALAAVLAAGRFREGSTLTNLLLEVLTLSKEAANFTPRTDLVMYCLKIRLERLVAVWLKSRATCQISVAYAISWWHHRPQA